MSPIWPGGPLVAETPRLGPRWPFALATFAGSFLLFLVQPLVARLALPRLGGAPAVWNSAMLVYQALLLAGYAYAHRASRWSARRRAGIHLLLLGVAASWLPLGLIAAAPPADGEAVLGVPWLVAASIGPLFLVLAAQAPLIQGWLADAAPGTDPYPLYAASNLGSFGGLIAYPLLLEPLTTLGTQSRLWSIGYGVVVLLVAGCATLLPRTAPVATAEEPALSPAPSRARVARWVLFAFVPSGLMLATTTFISIDIVPVPLLWVAPLGLYLLSYTVAFAANREPAELLSRTAPITVVLLGGVLVAGYQARPYLNLFAALLLLFMAATALHTQLYRDRPAPDRLTGFYLATAAGGALGGVFVALVAPVAFAWLYEYPLLILAAGLMLPQSFLTGWLKRLWNDHYAIALAGVAAVLAILLWLRLGGVVSEEGRGPIFLAAGLLGLATVGARLPFAAVLASSVLLFGGWRAIGAGLEGTHLRSYFGVYNYVVRADERELDHGTTMHGVQLTGTPDRERTPTTYYAPGSGVGQAMRLVPALYGPAARVGVVGLGTGTLACYAGPGQRWRFYEIDPAIVRVARDSGRFSFLSRCKPDATIRLGDARVSLGAEPAHVLDVLALDAFSSDAVPVHLLTREAFATYARVLAPRGLLIVHISNRFLDLEPVVADAAAAGGWRAAAFDYQPSILDGRASASSWIALSRNPAVIAAVTRGERGWRPVAPRPGFAGWSDDYATILPLLRKP